MGIISGNSKEEPLHYGEVIGCWAYIGANKGLISGYEAFINHAGGNDLINLLKEAVDTMREENKKIEKVLKENGITPPPSLPKRGVASATEIPMGARFMDL